MEEGWSWVRVVVFRSWMEVEQPMDASILLPKEPNLTTVSLQDNDH